MTPESTESFDPIVHLVLGERINTAIEGLICEYHNVHARHSVAAKADFEKGDINSYEISKRLAVEAYGKLLGIHLARRALLEIFNTPNETRTLAGQKRKEIDAELARLDELIESAQAVTGALRGAIK